MTQILSQKISKYADDTKLGHREINIDYMIILQENINTLFEWANRLQMNCNVDKCSAMHIDHKKHAWQLYHVHSTVAKNRSAATSKSNF